MGIGGSSQKGWDDAATGVGDVAKAPIEKLGKGSDKHDDQPQQAQQQDPMIIVNNFGDLGKGGCCNNNGSGSFATAYAGPNGAYAAAGSYDAPPPMGYC